MGENMMWGQPGEEEVEKEDGGKKWGVGVAWRERMGVGIVKGDGGCGRWG